MSNLAIIPARGGSKRIPRKNIRDFLGKPIISYSIVTALKSGIFDEVMVSTDDQEIADIAMQYEAVVPFMRSAQNANDYATTVDVLLEVVQEYMDQGRSFDNICCLYPTAPFTTKEDLKNGLTLLEEANSSLPVVEYGFPILRAFKRNDNLQFVWPEHEKTRSQDMEIFYHDAGQWYWIKTETLLDEETLITSRCKAILKDRMNVQDIDTFKDWKLAELKFKINDI